LKGFLLGLHGGELAGRILRRLKYPFPLKNNQPDLKEQRRIADKN